MPQKKITATWLALIATIVLAVPVVFGWVSQAVELFKAPDKMNKFEERLDQHDKQLVAYGQSMDDIKSDLKEIKRALGIVPRSTRKTIFDEADPFAVTTNSPAAHHN